MKIGKSLVLLASSLAIALAIAATPNLMSGQSTINLNNLDIRVERPDRIREPQAPTSSNCYDGKDNFFNEIAIGSGTTAGTFYGYTANGYKNTQNENSTVASTCVTSGTQVYNMSGPVTGAAYGGNPDNSGTAFSSCGLWLDGSYKSGSTYYGFSHAEGYGTSTYGPVCDYPPTTKSMALLTSSDAKSWTLQEQIISNPSAHSPDDSEYGEGDCTPVPFSSYVYLYCRRTQDTQTSVARASSTSTFGPSAWLKYYQGSFSSAWDGSDDPLGLYGNSASIFANYGNIMLLRTELGGTGIQGVAMSFSTSSDGTQFATVPEPILYEIAYPFPYGSTTSDLVAYPSVVSSTDGSRTWSGFFLLTYTYVPNNLESGAAGAPDGHNGRTLVMRNVSVAEETTAQVPRVGVALSRWSSSAIGQRISSTEPVPYNFATAGFTYETKTGYIMTVAPSNGPSTELWECQNLTWPSTTNPDHTLTFANSSECSGSGATYVKLREAGWLYSANDPQPANTVPVYRCESTASGYTSGTHFTSTSSTCEGLGAPQYLLGYGLAN